MATSLCVRAATGFGFSRAWLAGCGRAASCLRRNQNRREGSGQLAVSESRLLIRNLTTTSKDTKIGIIGIGQVGKFNYI